MIYLNKTLITVAVFTALAGCSEDEYQGRQGQEIAPTHNGNIEITYSEKAKFGSKTGEWLNPANEEQATLDNGVGLARHNLLDGATDEEGEYLTVQNLTVEYSHCDATGCTVIEDNTGFKTVSDIGITIAPVDLIDVLDSGESRKAVYTYKISDGALTTDRSATYIIEGEDFEPEVSGSLTFNYKKSAGQPELDLLSVASDKDGEELTISDVVADENNPFEIPFSIKNGTSLVLDIDAVKDDLPNGKLSNFKFSYKVNDHRFQVDNQFEVNVLGVNFVEGAPEIEPYFLTFDVKETDATLSIDATQGVSDLEGDGIIAYDLKFNGSADLPFGVSLNDNTLKFNPHAFFMDVPGETTKDYVLTYKISDDNSPANVSDGERRVTIKVQGVESNLVVKKGATSDFEDQSDGESPKGWVKVWTASATPAPVVSSAEARSGNNSVLLGIGTGMYTNLFASEDSSYLAPDRHYYYTAWYKTVDQDNSNFVYLNMYGTGRGWWVGGQRPPADDSTQWTFASNIFNTTSTGLASIVPDGKFMAYNGPSPDFSDTQVYVDDMHVVDITDVLANATNMLDMNDSGFENNELPTTNGEGSVTVVTTENSTNNAAINGDFVLKVDTSGKTAGSQVEVLIPVPQGAVQNGGRYMLTYDAQPINGSETGVNPINFQLETASGAVMANDELWGQDYRQGRQVILDTQAVVGAADWANEDVFIRFKFPGDDLEYYLDNVILFAIP